MPHDLQNSGTAAPDPWYGWRYVGFVAANMTIVGGLSFTAWRSIPPLREIPWVTLVPVNVLALFAFLALYPALRWQRPGMSRLASLYLAFVATFAAYGVFLSFAFPINAQLSVPAHVLGSISLGHFYGVPVLGLCALMNWLLSRAFFPRPAGA